LNYSLVKDCSYNKKSDLKLYSGSSQQGFKDMTIRHSVRLISIAGALAISGAASASPLFDVFGPLDEATFGGTGIPNDEVAISSQFSNGSLESGGSLITVAMSATQRYTNPALTNDGAGTYFANAGSSIEGPSSIEGALWNFNFYLDIESTIGETLKDYQFTLFYDFNPAFDNGPATLGTINLTNYILGSTTPLMTRLEDSQNLMFSFLAADIAGLIDAPPGAFDPNVNGEYNFGIAVSQAGWGVENVRMDVQVVPVPAAVWLFGSALGLLGWIRRGKLLA
jgi:hypothetical protein